jgi:uncharacterized protein (DUF58 family)
MASTVSRSFARSSNTWKSPEPGHPRVPKSNTMLPEELIRKVRLIEVTTRKMVDDVMSGSYRSSFKGQGVQFSEHRVYMPGDDIRHIDWKVSARSREPLIKKYEEERELTVFLVVDVSGSENFGSTKKLKSEMAAEIAGMLAYAAVHTGDKIGVMLFGGEVEKIIPPKKGKQHILRVIRDVLSYRPRTQGTDLAGALESTNRVMKHGGIVFVVSDFMAEGYEVSLKRLARKHDVVAVTVGDVRETEVPEGGQFVFVDPETGRESWVDTSSYAFRKWLKEFRSKSESELTATLKSAQVERLRVLTQEDYGEAVVRFFRARSRRGK